jgi:hypothetical protein
MPKTPNKIRVIVKPPEKDAYLHDRFGFLAMYIGRVTINGDTMIVVPCRGITEKVAMA